MKYILVSLIIANFVLLSFALPSTPFTKEAEIVEFVNSQQIKNIKDGFHYVKSLEAFNKNIEKSKENEICNLAKQVLTSSSKTNDIKNIYYAVHASSSLKCDIKSNDEISRIIYEAAKKDSTETVFYATASAFKLRENKQIDFDDSEFYNVIEYLNSVSAVDGTFKSSTKESSGTLFHSGLALQTLAIIQNSSELDSDAEFVVETLRENVESILELTRKGNGDITFSSRSSLPTADNLLNGALNFVNVADVHISNSGQYFSDLTDFALNSLAFKSLEETYHFGRLIKLLTSNKVNSSPLVLALQQTSISTGSSKGEGNLQVKVTDLFNSNVDNLKVFLVKASSLYNEKAVIAANQQLQSTSPSDFTLNLLASKPEPGFYNLEFAVQQGSNTVRSTSRTIKIISSAAVDSVLVKVIDSADKEVVESHTVQAGKKLGSVKTSYFYTLGFTFTVKNKNSGKPIEVQQAFIRLFGEGGEVTSSAVLVADSNEYTAYINIKSVGEKLGFKSGDYSVELIIGDSFIDNSFSWSLGTVAISFPPSLQRSSTPTNIYATKPEIQHLFRQPEKRPAATTSLAFTGGVVAPLVLVVLAGLAKNKYAAPTGLGLIASFIFIALIGGIFSVYAFFWFGFINMFQTLGYAAPLAVSALLIGNVALKQRHDSRTAKAE